MTFPLMPFPSSVTGGTQTLTDGQSFVVPPGVSSVSSTLIGAGGGGGGGNTLFGGAGGSGARVVQTALAVTPGETLTVTGGVGGAAGTNGTLNTPTSGQNGTTISLLRGGTTLMSATAGQRGTGASHGGGESSPGVDGADGSGGTGGTVTAGAGAAGGAAGRNSPSVTPTAGGNGSITITWV